MQKDEIWFIKKKTAKPYSRAQLNTNEMRVTTTQKAKAREVTNMEMTHRCKGLCQIPTTIVPLNKNFNFDTYYHIVYDI
jgi:hypothetical protein